jgi:ankyrin repeat protein
MHKRRMIAIGCWTALLSVTGFGAGTSEVADAAMNRNRESIRLLLQKKTDVNAPQADGATALHWAVRYDDIETVDLLIKAGADVKAANRNGATPLFLATESGNGPIIERLLAAGVDANTVVLSRGETGLMLAARSGSVPAVKALVDHGANVNAIENMDGTTALMWAASEDHAAVIKFLAEHGADIATRSKVVAPRAGRSGGGGNGNNAEEGPTAAPGAGGLTALVIAAREGNMDSVRALVAAGADVNQASADQTTPLLVAVQNGFYNVGGYLLDHAANPNLANAKGWNPVYMTVKNRNIETGTVPLPNEVGELEFLKLLLDRGANPNLRIKADTEVHSGFKAVWLEEEGATPFFRAAIAGDMTVLKLLLKYGADPSIKTTHGATALMAAAGVGWTDGFSHEYSEKETLDVMKMLIDMGADVNASDDRKVTALHGAAYKAANGAIQLLVEQGANLELRDNGHVGAFGNTVADGLTALDWAMGVPIGASSGIYHPESVELLTKLMEDRGIPVVAAKRTLGGNAGAKKQQ